MVDVAAVDTRTLILEAARRRLLADGYAGLSTRKVAEQAQVPVSQLHYHFGSKQGLILALFAEENQRRLDRQRAMYAADLPLWRRYERACDYLEDDLDSGYVRVLQEMIAAGWSNPGICEAVRELLSGWFHLLSRRRPRGRAPPRNARPVHGRGAGRAGRVRVHRRRGAAAARLRPPAAADPLGAAAGRRGPQAA